MKCLRERGWGIEGGGSAPVSHVCHGGEQVRLSSRSIVLEGKVSFEDRTGALVHRENLLRPPPARENITHETRGSRESIKRDTCPQKTEHIPLQSGSRLYLPAIRG